MRRTPLRHRVVRLTVVGLAVGLVWLGSERSGFATKAEPPRPDDVMFRYAQRLDAPLKRCAARLNIGSFGDVIVSVLAKREGPLRFELDVSRSLGTAIIPCLRSRFRPILATMLAEAMPSAGYYVYDVVEVGPRRALPRVAPSFMRLWIRDGAAGSAARARLKARLPAEASLESDGCLRLRGTDAFSEMAYQWLNRDARPIDPGKSEVLTRQLAIPPDRDARRIDLGRREVPSREPDQLLGAWMAPPQTILLLTEASGDTNEIVPKRLCAAKLDDPAVARFFSKPP